MNPTPLFSKAKWSSNLMATSKSSLERRSQMSKVYLLREMCKTMSTGRLLLRQVLDAWLRSMRKNGFLKRDLLDQERRAPLSLFYASCSTRLDACHQALVWECL